MFLVLSSYPSGHNQSSRLVTTLASSILLLRDPAMALDAPRSSVEQLEGLIRRFEQAWNAGQRPAIEEYVEGTPSAQRWLTCELIHADLEFRLRAGDDVRVEEYLRRFPELARDADAVVELLVAECHCRVRLGQPPGPTEYSDRFPEHEGAVAATVGATAGLQPPPSSGRPGEPLPERLGRYRIGRLLARGGMGEVHRVHDLDFDRPLAMKVLQARYGDDAALQERFLREARLTGQLQHPGIPPVQELGQLPDGRPYFIMKLVKGHDLQAALRGREAPRADGYYLGIFEQLCRTVGYAHARGIIHRDLKPGNVMVGAFGEVQLMDWGLAKVLPASPLTADSAPPIASVSTIEHLRAATPPSEESVAGTVIGTPAYMAPEQARGEIEKLDATCDVFGLGGILCEILTGKPTFVGTALENQRQAMRGDLSDAHARLKASGADAEVIALARHCLAAEARHRPADAGKVAEAMAAYQELVRERLRQAEVAKAQAQVRAEEEHKRLLVERQKRRVTLALAGAVLLVLVGGVTGTLVVFARQAQAERRRAVAEAAIHDNLDQAAQARAALAAELKQPGGVFTLLNDPADWQARGRAVRSLVERARAVLDTAEEGVDAALTERTASLASQLQQDDADRALAVALENIRMDRSVMLQGQFDDVGVARKYPKAFADAGLAVATGEPDTVADRLRQSPIREALVAALDDWAWVVFLLRHHDLARQLLAIARLTAPDPEWGDRLRQLETWRDQAALTALVRQAPVARLPPSLLSFIGTKLADDNPVKEAWQRQAQALYPADFWLNFGLGHTLFKAGSAEAVAFMRAALAVRPRSCAAHNNLGASLAKQQRIAEALAAYRKALEIDPRYPYAWNNLGGAYAELERLPEAAAALEKAIELDPYDVVAYTNLGNVRQRLHQLPEARAAVQRALELDAKFAYAHGIHGRILTDQQKLSEALAAYRKAIELEPRWADGYIDVGNTLAKQGRLPEAIDNLRKAIKVDAKSAKAYGSLGALLDRNKQPAEAIAAYRKAVELAPQSALAYYNLGAILTAAKRLPEAIAAGKRAVELDPKHAQAWSNLGAALIEHRQVPEAIEAFQKARALAPTLALVHVNLGIAYAQDRRLPEAVAALRKAIDLEPKLALAHDRLGSALHQQAAFAEAVRASEEALRVLPSGEPLRTSVQQRLKSCQILLALEKRIPAVLAGKAAAGPNELLQLAELCRYYREAHASAARLYREAFKGQPSLAEDVTRPHRYYAAWSAVLAGTGRSKDAAPLSADDRTALRQQARAWLQADLDVYAKDLRTGKSALVLRTVDNLGHWQAEARLATVRDEKDLAMLPAEEAGQWQKLWRDVAALFEEARGRFTESRTEGELTEKAGSRVHEWNLVAGRTYLIDMQSAALDSYLKLEDGRGKLLAENDDIEPGIVLDARLTVTAPSDGVYRIIATSFEQAGTGLYSLRIREFKEAK
jgi:tetratricopeptide (TPR) repeat protein